MLSYRSRRVVVFDHVAAAEVPAPTGWALNISNPTAHDAAVCVFVESNASAASVLDVNAMDRCRRVGVRAGASVVVPVTSPAE